MIRKTVLAAAAFALVLGACSSDDDSSAQSDIVEALKADPGSEGMTDEQLDCFAGGLIDAVGEDEAKEFAEDPDAWVEGKMTAALEEGIETAPDIEALTPVFADCGIDVDPAGDDMDDMDADDMDMEEEPSEEETDTSDAEG